MGKWHLGYPPAFGPLKSGYEEFFGPMSGGVDYFTHCASTGAHDLFLGDAEHQQPGYLTDLITQRSVDYVQRMAEGARAGTPFFLSVHYTAPHWPWETRDDEALAQEVKAQLFHLHGGNIHSYQRMIHHMDEGIGQIVAALQQEGLLQDTLVVFTSDNGGERFSDNWPLVGGKMDLTEGGIRVPWIAHWPALIRPGGVSLQHCLTMDWSATMLELAGVAAQADYPLDGVSLLPVLRAPADCFVRPMFWRMNHRGQRAYREGIGNICASMTSTICSTSRRMSASVPTWPGVSRRGWSACALPGWTGRPACRRSRQTPPSAWAIRCAICRSVEGLACAGSA